jgi:hypothetical protein
MQNNHAINPFASVIAEKLKTQTEAFTLDTVIVDWFKIGPYKATRDISCRIGFELRAQGCKRIERRNSEHRFWYEPPAQPVTIENDVPGIVSRRNKRPGEPVLTTDDPMPLNPTKGLLVAFVILITLFALIAGGYCIYKVSQKDSSNPFITSRIRP